MFQVFKLKTKWLPLALPLLFGSIAQAADDKPSLNFNPPTSVIGASAIASTPPASSSSTATLPAMKVATEEQAAKNQPGTNSSTTSPPVSSGKSTATSAIVKNKVSATKAEKVKAKPQRVDLVKDEVSYSPQDDNEIVVSDHDLNDFIFASPISNGPILPAGVPLLGKPIYMANNTQVLMQFQKGFDKPIQVVVETEDGIVHKLYLKPRPVNGITYRVDGAQDLKAPQKPKLKAKSDVASEPMAGTHNEDVELLKRAVNGDIPADFESVTLPNPTRFDKFTVVPLSGWADSSGKKIMIFSLIAAPGKSAVVAPTQFYRQGITAVMLTSDQVSDTTTPQLYVVEEPNDE